MSSKTNAFNGYESNLNGGITDSATSLTADSAGGMVHPAYLVLDPQSITLREVIKVGTISGTTFSGLTRGLAGSVSGAQAHASGVVIRSVPVHQELDDIYTDIIALEAADAGHFGGTDTADHPEVTGSVRGFMTAADKTALDADPPHPEDHAARHLPAGADPITTAVPTTSHDLATPNTLGTAESLAKSDHAHAINEAETVDLAAIGTANAQGTSPEIPRADHVHEITDARDVAVIGDSSSINGNSSLVITFADKVTKTFNMPSGWNTALIVARGTMEIDEQTGGVGGPVGNLEFRMEIGSDNGLTMVHIPIIPVSETVSGDMLFSASHNAVVSGNVTVAIAARKTVSADSFEFRLGELSYIAMRAS